MKPDVTNQTAAQAYDIITTKETWFYRDWQVALGDIMIKEVSGASRRFDVIGFGGFESIWLCGDEREKIWLSRLNGIVDDLDISKTDDCRVQQLQKVLLATAELVNALARISTTREIISKKTLNTAKHIITNNRISN